MTSARERRLPAFVLRDKAAVHPDLRRGNPRPRNAASAARRRRRPPSETCGDTRPRMRRGVPDAAGPRLRRERHVIVRSKTSGFSTHPWSSPIACHHRRTARGRRGRSNWRARTVGGVILITLHAANPFSSVVLRRLARRPGAGRCQGVGAARRRCSMCMQRSITTVMPALSARAAASSLTTPSCSQSTGAPMADRVLHDGRHGVGPAEHVDHVDARGRLAQRRVGALAQHLGLARVDRDDAVAVLLQVLRRLRSSGCRAGWTGRPWQSCARPIPG